MELKQSGLFLARTLSYEVCLPPYSTDRLSAGCSNTVQTPAVDIRGCCSHWCFCCSSTRELYIFVVVLAGCELRAAASHHRPGVQGAVQQRDPRVA